MADIIASETLALDDGRPHAAAATDDRAGHRVTLERSPVERVRRIAGGSEREAERVGELVVLNQRDESVDHALRMLEVGVEQHDSEYTLAGVSQQVGIAHLA